MENVDKTVKTHVHIIGLLFIYGVTLQLLRLDTPLSLLEAVRHLPHAITVYLILCIIFTRWLWHWKCLQGWLVKMPYIQGTWYGDVASDWVNPITQNTKASRPITLVIKQTYSSLSCILYTKESSSCSTAAQISRDVNGDLYLNYNYTNQPKMTVRDRRKNHVGAAILQIITQPERKLEGEYWTMRKTRGKMKLKFVSRKLSDRFLKKSEVK